jgi:thymidylate kinase
MITKVFLLGRPGSGKTTAFRYFETLAQEHGLYARRFQEYTILYEMFQTGRREFRPTMYGGFDVLDFTILNVSAQLLEKQVLEYSHSSVQSNELLFLEIAHDDYKQAMKAFSLEFLQDAYFVFFEADIEKCIQRIRYRVTHPTGADDHFISEHILRGYYAKDNQEYMATRFKADYGIQKRVEVIKNSDSFADFTEKLKSFAHAVFSENFVAEPA